MLSRNNSLEKTSREGQARSQLRTTTTSLRYDPAAIETLFVGLFLESQTRAQAQIVLDLPRTIRCVRPRGSGPEPRRGRVLLKSPARRCSLSLTHRGIGFPCREGWPTTFGCRIGS